MVSRRRLIGIVIFVVLAGLLLVGCERPLPGTSSEATATPESGVVVTDENVGGGTPEDSQAATEEEAAGEAAPEEETPREEENSGETDDGAASGEAEGYPAPAEEATDAPADDAATSEEAATSDEAATDEAATDEAAADESATNTDDSAAASTDATTTETTPTDAVTTETTEARPASHIVAAGENLYRIGLKYGISWVTLAQHNGIPDANRIVVGQEIKLPGLTPETQPTPTPSPLTEEVYTVQAGDTLFRIGQAYGLNWTQIAEANGIVNPNQITVGQQLKIPVDKPSTTQQSFVHTVQAGETLFLISLRYGVAWPAVAEANKLQSPYVIFPGQTLVIPGK